MTVNGTSVNDAPTAVASSVTTNEDIDYTFAAADFCFSDASDAPAAYPQFRRVLSSLPLAGSLRYNATALTAADLPKTVSLTDFSAGKLVFRRSEERRVGKESRSQFKVQD